MNMVVHVHFPVLGGAALLVLLLAILVLPAGGLAAQVFLT